MEIGGSVRAACASPSPRPGRVSPGASSRERRGIARLQDSRVIIRMQRSRRWLVESFELRRNHTRGSTTFRKGIGCVSSRGRGKVRRPRAAPSTCVGFVMGHWPLAKPARTALEPMGVDGSYARRDYEPLAAIARNYVRDRTINRAEIRSAANAAPSHAALRRAPNRARALRH